MNGAAGIRGLVPGLSAVLSLALFPVACAEGTPGPLTATDYAYASSDLYKQGDLQEAAKLLAEATTAHPDDAQLHFMLGNAHYRLENYSEASASYEAAARLRPTHPDTPLCLGFSYYYAGETGKACEAWSESVDLSPDDALPRVSLAVGLLADGQQASAEKILRTAIEQDPQWQQRVELDMRFQPEVRQNLAQLAEQVRARRE